MDLIKTYYNKYWLITITLHLFLLFVLFNQFGLNTLLEGDKYLTDAEQLINGNIKQAFEYQTFYCSYILYLSFYKLLHLPNWLIFIGNYSLSLFAYSKFYSFLKYQTNDNIAKLWLLLMMCSPLLQFWHFNLFSESFFIAINLLFVAVLFQSKRNQYLIISLALLLVFARPVGFFSVLVFSLLFLSTKHSVSIKTILIIGLSLLGSLFAVLFFHFPLHYKGYCVDISKCSIYCGFPQFTESILPKKDYTLYQCYYFIAEQHGLWFTLKLFLKKVASFFVLSRPYYTNFHNLINLSHIIFYAFGFYGLLKSNTIFQSLLHKHVTILIVLNACLIGLFFNEWSERYTVVIFPFIFVLAANGLLNLHHSIKKIIVI